MAARAWEPGRPGVDVTGGLMTKRYLPSGGPGSSALRPRALLVGPGVALVAAAALALTGCGSSSEGPSQAVLAGSATDEAASTPDVEIDPMPTDGETPTGGEPWDAAATERCRAAVGAGLTQVAQTSDGVGVTTFWAKRSRWALCDVVAGAEPSVIEGSTKGRPGFDEQALSLVTTAWGAADETTEGVRFVAGGPLPWPLEEISYTFPDGHVEEGRFVTGVETQGDGWWAVTYTATDGVLVDPATGADELDPVTVTIVGAAAEAFRLPWEDLQRSE
jgi:hypothetical protein